MSCDICIGEERAKSHRFSVGDCVQLGDSYGLDDSYGVVCAVEGLVQGRYEGQYVEVYFPPDEWFAGRASEIRLVTPAPEATK